LLLLLLLLLVLYADGDGVVLLLQLLNYSVTAFMTAVSLSLWSFFLMLSLFL